MRFRWPKYFRIVDGRNLIGATMSVVVHSLWLRFLFLLGRVVLRGYHMSFAMPHHVDCGFRVFFVEEYHFWLEAASLGRLSWGYRQPFKYRCMAR